MKDRVHLGPAPAEEACAQVGSDGYAVRALRECRAYAEAIRAVVGPEPEGARLRVVRASHDFGDYYEVACEYDGGNRLAAGYAALCDEKAPATWAEAGMPAPEGPMPRAR